MRCAHCHRALTREPPALTIKTRSGVLTFGPTCAKRIEIKPTRTAHKVFTVRARAVAVDPAQLPLDGMGQ